MFSGKTEELIRRLTRAKNCKQNIIIFKPSIENRYEKNKVVSHDSKSIDCELISNSQDIKTIKK